MQTRHAVTDSPLGDLTLVAEGDVLVGVYFRRHWYRPSIEEFGQRVDIDGDAVLAEVRSQLGEYLSGSRVDFDLPTALRGSRARRQIWERLRAIPYGQTATYGELAKALADGMTAREVGAVVGRNPLSVVVPCHRVVGKNGKLTGYAGGLDRKRFLLRLEEPAEVREARLF